MPHLKNSENPDHELVRLLKGYDVTASVLMQILGIKSATTARKFLKSPDLMTGRQWRTLCRMQHIPPARVYDAMNYQS